MTPQNKHILRSKISEAKTRQLVKHFVIDLTATQLAQVTGLNRNTVNRIVVGIREGIAAECEEESPVKGEVEVDDSYFRRRRIRGVTSRGTRKKTIVFGLFKRQDQIYTQTASNVSRTTLQAITQGRVDLESVIHSYGW